MEVTRALARFVVRSRPEDIPAPARREAVRSLVNWLGCALGGSRHEAVDIALEALAPFAGAPQASVLGRRERLDCLNAALVNGMSAHVLDFDDTQLRTLLHPGVPVASALLALAERRAAIGRAISCTRSCSAWTSNAASPTRSTPRTTSTGTSPARRACSAPLRRRGACWASTSGS